ncbi:hypothetical protein RHMOL_Rhmol04G0226800 [Rhododendron molle]|uniref:Uncharacterized protein n=1 Tax=Rhododendron molle TaxID=49168 RepID=A0ACC0P356_RHOML|nr:hypothetical protein RHMOL_Rhmol04G0226800 [Rhododendron molle]
MLLRKGIQLSLDTRLSGVEILSLDCLLFCGWLSFKDLAPKIGREAGVCSWMASALFVNGKSLKSIS